MIGSKCKEQIINNGYAVMRLNEFLPYFGDVAQAKLWKAIDAIGQDKMYDEDIGCLFMEFVDQLRKDGYGKLPPVPVCGLPEVLTPEILFHKEAP